MSVTRSRSQRLEVRTTPEERALIDRAVAEQGTDLTEFVISNLTVAARRVLADRSEFTLDPRAIDAWEQINRRRGRDLPGLRRLMERPSPFVDECGENFIVPSSWMMIMISKASCVDPKSRPIGSVNMHVNRRT